MLIIKQAQGATVNLGGKNLICQYNHQFNWVMRLQMIHQQVQKKYKQQGRYVRQYSSVKNNYLGDKLIRYRLGDKRKDVALLLELRPPIKLRRSTAPYNKEISKK